MSEQETAKHPGGRPTDYSAEVLRKTDKYLKECKDEAKVVGKGKSLAVTTRVRLPKVSGLARYLAVARSTIYKWAEEHPEFSDKLEQILAEQEERLVDNGLGGQYNSTITKLILAKHGYRDAADLTSNGETLKPMVVDSTVAARFMDAPSEPAEDSQE